MNLVINEPETYLGKQFSQIDEKITLKQKNSSVLSDLLSHEYDPEEDQLLFLNEICKRFVIKTNQSGVIVSVFLRTEAIMDSDMFQLLVKKYGHPSQMIKMGKIKESKKSVKKDYVSSEIRAEAVNCTFKDDPIFIIWTKPKYTIHIEMDYNRNTSLITFKSNKY